MLKDKDEDKPPLLWVLNVAAVDNDKVVTETRSDYDIGFFSLTGSQNSDDENYDSDNNIILNTCHQTRMTYLDEITANITMWTIYFLEGKNHSEHIYK